MKHWFSSIACLLLAACGTRGAADAAVDAAVDAAIDAPLPTTDFAISLEPASAARYAGATLSVAVTVARGGGFTDPVNLSLEGLPGGFLSSFDANPVMDGTTLTVTLPDDATIGSVAEIMIVGTAGSLRHEATLAITVEDPVADIDVRVIDTEGTPLANVQVAVADQEALQTTSADGRVVFTSVRRPFDLFVRNGSTDILYVGVERIDPTVVLPPGYAGADPYGMQLSAAARFGRPAVPTDQLSYIFVGGDVGQTSGGSVSQPNGVDLRWGLGWPGTSSVSTLLYVILSDETNPSVLRTIARPLTLVDGVDQMIDLDFGIRPTPTQNVSAAVNTADAAATASVSVFWIPDPTAPDNDLEFTPSNTGSVVATVPRVPGATLDVSGRISRDGSSLLSWQRGLRLDVGTVTITIDETPPATVAPANGAANVIGGSAMRWTSIGGLGDDGLSVVEIQAEDPGGGTESFLYVVTDRTEIALPNLSALGVGLTGSTQYIWLVHVASDITSIEDALAPTAPAQPLTIYTAQRETVFGATALASFTTAATP